ncbi:MAG: hydroxyphenylacetyl-CoA thioesterase PaaI [Thiothrix sp.]|nr:MAG: hydroxyphenylacetyl-CoA thioesterase PaaI [Thiothrix sp.]
MAETDPFARACSDAMEANDRASRMMGITIVESVAGRSVVTMKVRDDMLNGHDVCHGGMLFTMADTAFAHACNNTNKVTLASGCTIDFLAPAYEGELLTASAIERSRSGRTGVYDVEIHNPEGKLVATFRGRSYQLKGSVLPET